MFSFFNFQNAIGEKKLIKNNFRGRIAIRTQYQDALCGCRTQYQAALCGCGIQYQISICRCGSHSVYWKNSQIGNVNKEPKNQRQKLQNKIGKVRGQRLSRAVLAKIRRSVHPRIRQGSRQNQWLHRQNRRSVRPQTQQGARQKMLFHSQNRGAVSPQCQPLAQETQGGKGATPKHLPAKTYKKNALMGIFFILFFCVSRETL